MKRSRAISAEKELHHAQGGYRSRYSLGYMMGPDYGYGSAERRYAPGPRYRGERL